MRRFAVLLAVALAATLLPATAPALAAASRCLPAGGARVPSAPVPSAEFAVLGKGWGHGAGMSQYGARGAARLGCSARRILRTYYPGVTIGTDPASADRKVRVAVTFGSLSDNVVRTLDVEAGDNGLPWEVCGAHGCRRVAGQPQHTRWRARVLADGSYILYDAAGRRAEAGGIRTALLRARLSVPGGRGRIARLPGNGHRYRWGVLELDSYVTGGRGRAYVNVVVPTVELYLRGLAEMPSSWEAAALRAQAIVGRSYAMHHRRAGRKASCRCHLYDSVLSQAYTGWDKESEGADAVYGRRWVDAVTHTATRVIKRGDAIAVGYYSSSHGGHSESGAFTWGTETSYLQAVDDSRWEMASSNPIRSWSVGLSAATLGDIFGVGTATSVSRPRPRGAAGRVGRVEAGYGGVVVAGTAGSARVSGTTFRTRVNAALGYEAVRSTLFRVVRTDPCAAPRGADFAGTRRVATGGPVAGAVQASRSAWTSAGTVLVGNPGHWRSMVGSAALSARRDAPLLLSGRDRLPAATKREIARLGARRVYILGGSSAISTAVADRLDAMRGVRVVTRLSGPSRYDTARKVALAAGPAADGSARVALVAGDASDPAQVYGFATAAAALAATPARLPTLLTARRSLPAPTRRALAGLRTRTVLLMGDGSLIAPAVASTLRAEGYRVRRVGTNNRYETSAATARRALRALPRSRRVVAGSYKRADVLQVAGALASRRDAILVLAASCDLDDTRSVRDVLHGARRRLSRATVVGSSSVIGERVRWQIGRSIAG